MLARTFSSAPRLRYPPLLGRVLAADPPTRRPSCRHPVPVTREREQWYPANLRSLGRRLVNVHEIHAQYDAGTRLDAGGCEANRGSHDLGSWRAACAVPQSRA